MHGHGDRSGWNCIGAGRLDVGSPHALAGSSRFSERRGVFGIASARSTYPHRAAVGAIWWGLRRLSRTARRCCSAGSRRSAVDTHVQQTGDRCPQLRDAGFGARPAVIRHDVHDVGVARRAPRRPARVAARVDVERWASGCARRRRSRPGRRRIASTASATDRRSGKETIHGCLRSNVHALSVLCCPAEQSVDRLGRTSRAWRSIDSSDPRTPKIVRCAMRPRRNLVPTCTSNNARGRARRRAKFCRRKSPALCGA